MPFFEKERENNIVIDNDRYQPIAVLAYTSAAGEITPMRFKMQLPDESIETVNIDGIKSHKDIPGGINYCCLVTTYGHQKQVTLRYFIREHLWVLLK